MLYPLSLLPIYKEKIWGGRNLARLLGKQLPLGLDVGESWEVGDDSVVANGTLAERKLGDLVATYGSSLTGTLSGDTGNSFPLLVKFIDAQDRLSVQVHPDDRYASQLEGEGRGKTEMWYVLDAVPGAEIVHGFEGDFARTPITASSASNLIDHLHRVPVKAGDVVFIPAGTIHAMGAGLVVCEVQQNCDLTYRLYDWDRLTPQGSPRELHVDKALQVCRAGPAEHKIEPLALDEPFGQRRILVACRYFAVELLSLVRPCHLRADGRSFLALVGLRGAAQVRPDRASDEAAQSVYLASGRSLVIPASAGGLTIAPQGDSEILVAYVPDLRLDIVQPLLQAGISKRQILCLGGDVGSANDLVSLL